jgi:hypothetical protein
MCNCTSLVRWVAVLILTVAVGGCLVGLIAPFWALYEPGLPRKLVSAYSSDSQNDGGQNDGAESAKGANEMISSVRLPAETEGLWARCNSVNYTQCILFWQNDFQLEHSFPRKQLASRFLTL